MGGGLEGMIDVKEKRIFHIGNEDSESAALATSQGSRMKIRVILKFFGSLKDASAGRALNNIQIVQNARDSGCRNAGTLRDGLKIQERELLAHHDELPYSGFDSIEMQSLTQVSDGAAGRVLHEGKKENAVAGVGLFCS
jgi:hypothetical protein